MTAAAEAGRLLGNCLSVKDDGLVMVAGPGLQLGEMGECVGITGSQRQEALIVADGFSELARGRLGASVAPERLDGRGGARWLARLRDGARLQRCGWTRQRARRPGGGSQGEQRDGGTVQCAHRS